MSQQYPPTANGPGSPPSHAYPPVGASPASSSGPYGPYQLPLGQTGALAWGLGLIVLACVPLLGSVIAGVAMTIAGASQRQLGGLAAQNGRNAANWGLTYTALTLVLLGSHFGLLWALTGDGGSLDGFFPFGIIITAWLVLTAGHIVVSVVGLVRACQRRSFAVPAIPFFRR